MTAVSWIPSEAIRGPVKLPFELGVTHYDEVPPDVLDDLDELRRTDRFREANRLHAYVEVDAGRITGYGHLGGGHIGATTVRFGGASLRFAAVHFPDLRPAPEVRPDGVRFVQTVGGRMGIPAPRPVARPPFVQLWSATAWTTLALTIGVDGSSSHELVGASPFPRHWIYDTGGRLVAKTATVDFTKWFAESFGKGTPWGDHDSPALAVLAETALERELSHRMMRGSTRPSFRDVRADATLVEQGDAGTDVFLLLDGILAVEVDGARVAELGPGAILGTRAFLESGRRTATLRAVTRCHVAVVPANLLDIDDLRSVASQQGGGTSAT